MYSKNVLLESHIKFQVGIIKIRPGSQGRLFVDRFFSFKTCFSYEQETLLNLKHENNYEKSKKREQKREKKTHF